MRCYFNVRSKAEMSQLTMHKVVVQGPDLQNVLRFIVRLYVKFIARSTYDNDLNVLRFLLGIS